MPVGRYFDRIKPDVKIAHGYVALNEAIIAYELKGRLAEAAAIRLLLQRMYAEFDQLAFTAADFATDAIRRRLRATSVRPPTSGRLERSIVSRPLASTLPAGAIGIGDLDALDQGAVNPVDRGVYWRSQEYGLPVFPQRPRPGYFSDAGGSLAAPDPSQFRVHAYFQPMSPTRGMPALVRKRPLAARHFLREGTKQAAAFHARETNSILGSAVSNLRRI